jgi:hypothetical protein
MVYGKIKKSDSESLVKNLTEITAGKADIEKIEEKFDF